MQSNQEIIQKADLALSELTDAKGALQPAVAAQFIRDMIKEAVIMGMATVVPMKAMKQKIDSGKFGDRILHAAESGQALSESQRSKPTFRQVELDADLFKAEVRIPYEVLEDSIEQGNLQKTILEMMQNRVATDIDDIVVNSDTTSGTADYTKFDGLLKAATSHTVDHAQAVTNRTLLKKMLRKMPSEYTRNKKALRFLVSHKSEIDYRDAIGDRGTVAGDQFVLSDPAAMYAGIPLEGVPLFPETQGGGSDTSALLLDPKNINIGVWRTMLVETERRISEGNWVAVLSMRMDFKYSQEDAVVKGYGISVA